MAVGQQLNLVVGQVKDFIMRKLLFFLATLGSTLFECGENNASKAGSGVATDDRDGDFGARQLP